jgi:hypothetical protein
MGEKMRAPFRLSALPTRFGFALSMLAFTAAPSFGGLVINPTFDSSITSNASSATLQADINQAISIYQSLYSDNITVNILYRYTTTAPNGSPLSGGLLAQSNYTVYAMSYGTYVNALIADKKSANDNIAVANLPGSALATNMNPSSANGRAVGLNTSPVMSADGNVGTGGTLDGIVTVNSSQPFQLTRTGGIASNKFDIMQSIEHEMDEVMGLGSVLPATTDFTGQTAVRPEDLYRYASPGVRSLTSSGSASSYFSIDGGTTNLAPFNQSAGGDYGDWGSNPSPLVQLAFSSPGTQSDVSGTSPEGVALDVVGYDLVPEPASATLFLAPAAFALGIRRRHR